MSLIKRDGGRGTTKRPLVLTLVIVLALLALPTLALAHLERPSYWPDPRPDRSITPAAGGEVPDARSLGSAVSGRGPGEVRVVCSGPGGENSMNRLRRSIQSARSDGFRLRPSQDKTFLTRKKAKKLRRINRNLAEDCECRAPLPPRLARSASESSPPRAATPGMVVGQFG